MTASVAREPEVFRDSHSPLAMAPPEETTAGANVPLRSLLAVDENEV